MQTDLTLLHKEDKKNAKFLWKFENEKESLSREFKLLEKDLGRIISRMQKAIGTGEVLHTMGMDDTFCRVRELDEEILTLKSLINGRKLHLVPADEVEGLRKLNASLQEACDAFLVEFQKALVHNLRNKMAITMC